MVNGGSRRAPAIMPRAGSWQQPHPSVQFTPFSGAASRSERSIAEAADRLWCGWRVRAGAATGTATSDRRELYGRTKISRWPRGATQPLPGGVRPCDGADRRPGRPGRTALPGTGVGAGPAVGPAEEELPAPGRARRRCGPGRDAASAAVVDHGGHGCGERPSPTGTFSGVSVMPELLACSRINVAKSSSTCPAPMAPMTS